MCSQISARQGRVFREWAGAELAEVKRGQCEKRHESEMVILSFIRFLCTPKTFSCTSDFSSASSSWLKMRWSPWLPQMALFWNVVITLSDLLKSYDDRSCDDATAFSSCTCTDDDTSKVASKNRLGSTMKGKSLNAIISLIQRRTLSMHTHPVCSVVVLILDHNFLPS